MSVRHTPRQHERVPERMHDMHSHVPPLAPPPSHPHGPPPPHLSASAPGPPPVAVGSAQHRPPPHAVPSPNVVPAGAPNPAIPVSIQKLAQANEQTWLLIGRVAEQMGDLEHALSAYENALRHNPLSLSGLTQVAGIARIKENYVKAVEYFQRALSLNEHNGEVWSALGHCYLMQDDLQKAYSAYQQALYLLPNPKEDPKLWYGIGILYDRYGSLDHAEEAFASVLKMDKVADFDKANEILFRLGIIYKQQTKYSESLSCFDRILRNPPNPLAHADIWFQIGHVYEQLKDFMRAKDAYERVVAENPTHAKVLQQLGWLYHQDGSSFQNQDLAIQYLTKSLEADSGDAQSWYLLGRAYMAGQKYNKAYEAYQQAVYRDGRNPTFWCSIGVLYFQINQYRDALDAYSRAIRINPYISEVWFDLGSLYESCNNQISDAIDAYARAAELDPNNMIIAQRLQLLKQAQETGNPLPAAPGPQDVHPTAYASAVVPPPGPPGPPMLFNVGPGNGRPVFRADSRELPEANTLHPITQPPPGHGRSSPGPFRGGPPPPVILDESRMPHGSTTLAPMEIDRPPVSRQPTGISIDSRDGPPRGPPNSSSVLLHHPVPQQQIKHEEIRPSGQQYHRDSYRGPHGGPGGPPSPPLPHIRTHSPPGFSGRPPVGPGQNGAAPRPSPHGYAFDPQAERDRPFDRRRVPSDREWDDRERRTASNQSYPNFPEPVGPGRPPSPQHHHRGRPQSRQSVRGQSPPAPSPRNTQPSSRPFWDSKHGPPPPLSRSHANSPPPGPGMHGDGSRYPPRYDVPSREYDSRRPDGRSTAGSPDTARNGMRGPPPPVQLVGSNGRGSESPRSQSMASEGSKGRKRAAKDDREGSEQPKKERKPRRAPRRVKEEPSRAGSPKTAHVVDHNMIPQHQGYTKVAIGNLGKANGTPEPGSSNGSRSNGSMQPSPTSATPIPPTREVDEDYDEGVTDALMSLSGYRGPPEGSNGSMQSATTSRSMHSHRGSISSSVGHASPSHMNGGVKRPMSPGSDEFSDTKRSRTDAQPKRRMSSASADRRTPVPSTRPSPIPFRQQPSSHPVSPQERPPGLHGFAPSPPLPAILPPHPRPIGTGMSSHASVALPPIATLPSSATAPTPPPRDRDDEMQHSRMESSRRSSHSASPTQAPASARSNKLADMMHRSSASPKSKGSPPAASTMQEKMESTA